MNRTTIFMTILTVAVVSCSTDRGAPMEESHIRFELDKPQQVVRHFGASAAWWAQVVGTWPEEHRGQIMDLLFDHEVGIDLDLIRYNLGGGKATAIITDPMRKAETIESRPGVYDAERDAAAVRITDMAVERGAEVVVFANSPPTRLTVTGAPTGNNRTSNLVPGGERDFAEYLIGASIYLAESRGWPIIDISPINEPQWDWAPKNGQEGSYWTPDDAYRVVRALYEEIRRRDLDLGISAPDSAEMKLASNRRFIDLILGDEELRDHLGHYALHSYWSDRYDSEAVARYLERRYPDVELWMTEWTEMKGGRDYGMDSALVLATTLHEDMTITQASSWQYWIAVSPTTIAMG